ncbi:peflin [Anaeramoeba flamelloides]|uniref:Peflin n=1 Tax=Anaeramoeba flamelloides TaxID=1746091 RepID=A0AAV7Z1Q1_9EUKA|nr:peflin [Anaeramoeba flamelloides]
MYNQYQQQQMMQQQQQMMQQQRMLQEQQRQQKLLQYFNFVDKDKSGTIEKEELALALKQGGMVFSYETCGLLVKLFDSEKKNGVNITEFYQLYNFVVNMRNSFLQVDQDKSGTIDANELAVALKYSGYNFPNNVILMLINKFGKNNQIKIDDWISLCTFLQHSRAVFMIYDNDRDGKVSLDFNAFLSISALLK